MSVAYRSAVSAPLKAKSQHFSQRRFRLALFTVANLLGRRTKNRLLRPKPEARLRFGPRADRVGPRRSRMSRGRCVIAAHRLPRAHPRRFSSFFGDPLAALAIL